MVLAIRKTLLNRQLACSRGLLPMLSSAWGLEPAHEHMTCLGRQKVVVERHNPCGTIGGTIAEPLLHVACNGSTGPPKVTMCLPQA
jgi:hypothetical protein